MRASFVFSEVLTGLRRNITMTIAMILTTAVSLGMLGAGVLVVRKIDQARSEFLANVEVSVYFNNDISTNDQNCTLQECQELRQSLERNQAVESVVYENRAAAFERAKRVFRSEPAMLEATRPESLPSSLQVKLKDPTRGEIIVRDYGGKPGVQRVVDQKDFVDRLVGLLNGVRDGTFVTALVALIAALLLISNTIQLSAFTRRTEVGIMRLVGATRWYTQLPFLLEAVASGVIGAFLGTLMLLGAKLAFVDEIIKQMGGAIPSVSTFEVFFPVFPILLAVSIVISALTGYVTLRLYVRH